MQQDLFLLLKQVGQNVNVNNKGSKRFCFYSRNSETEYPVKFSHVNYRVLILSKQKQITTLT